MSSLPFAIPSPQGLPSTTNYSSNTALGYELNSQSASRLGVENTLVGYNVFQSPSGGSYSNFFSGCSKTTVVGNNNDLNNLNATTVIGNDNYLSNSNNSVVVANQFRFPVLLHDQCVYIANTQSQAPTLSSSGNDQVIVDWPAQPGNGTVIALAALTDDDEANFNAKGIPVHGLYMHTPSNSIRIRLA
jgi:hypothetical protein